jgi:prepilin-type N-terminal cleavage/methylation domain-containing protein
MGVNMNSKINGFTLIELLVVIALIGIIAVISIQVGRSVLQRTSSSSAINTFVSDLSSIKQSAIKENRYFAISFNADGVSYTIQRQTNIGDLTNWTDISTQKPLEGKEFFDKAIVTGAWRGFAINPIGIVFNLPIAAGAVPMSQNLTFRLPGKTPGTYDYIKNILIYSNGGIKIE